MISTIPKTLDKQLYFRDQINFGDLDTEQLQRYINSGNLKNKFRNGRKFQAPNRNKNQFLRKIRNQSSQNSTKIGFRDRIFCLIRKRNHTKIENGIRV